MGKEGEKAEVSEYDPNKKYKDFKWENSDDFKNGPMGDNKRQCRDILCCIIFVLFLCGCVAVCVLGVSYGDPNVILYPYDDDGKQCGRDEYKDYKYLYFYSVVSNLQNFTLSKTISGFCVKDCPKDIYNSSQNPADITVDCKPTTNNLNCNIKYHDFYNSTKSKFYFLIFSDE